MRMYNKKASHVGMMVSFAIFVIFLTFLYAAIQPSLEIKQKRQDVLNSVEKEILNAFSSNLTTILIQPKVDPLTDCLIVENIISSGENFAVFDENGNRLVSEKDGSDIKINFGGENIIKIYISDSLSLSVSATNLNLEVVEPKFIIKDKRIFEKKIRDVVEEYNSNYKELKNDLGVLSQDEFDFNFTLENGTVLSAFGKPRAESIYAKKVIVYYFDEEANLEKGELSLRVWRY